MSKLYVVGIGPGSRNYLTQAALDAVNNSDTVIGSKRALNLFKTDSQKIEINAKNMDESLKESVDKVKNGQTVAILSTGDPGFSGVLKPILNLKSGIEIEVIPGVSSVQLCAAKLKIPWDDADLITMHGKGISEEILDIIDNGKPLIILPNFKPAELAKFLIENGVDKNRKIAVCEKLSYEDEKIVESTLKDISGMKFGHMCVVVVY